MPVVTLGILLGLTLLGALIGRPVYAELGQYRATKLPSGFAPSAINTDGVVVGSLEGHAVRWQAGTSMRLPSPAGANAEAGSGATDLNDAGQIVGTVDGQPGLS